MQYTIVLSALINHIYVPNAPSIITSQIINLCVQVSLLSFYSKYIMILMVVCIKVHMESLMICTSRERKV